MCGQMDTAARPARSTMSGSSCRARRPETPRQRSTRADVGIGERPGARTFAEQRDEAVRRHDRVGDVPGGAHFVDGFAVARKGDLPDEQALARDRQFVFGPFGHDARVTLDPFLEQRSSGSCRRRPGAGFSCWPCAVTSSRPRSGTPRRDQDPADLRDGRQPALHVGGATTIEDAVLDVRRWVLDRYGVGMTVELEDGTGLPAPSTDR